MEEYQQQLLKDFNLELPRFSNLGPYCPPKLQQAIDYSLLENGGKRLRPLLTLLSTKLCGGDCLKALPVAAAVEMIHTYSLIHDDLPAMDDDVLRRGQPTSHIKFGYATAILAGDALQSLAFETIAQYVDDPQTARCCSKILAHAAGPLGMVAGQQDDLDSTGITFVSDFTMDQKEELLLRIHRRKTAAIINAALLMGACIANADSKQFGYLELFGDAFGMVFQITDDILDQTATAEELGKTPGKDAKQGKLTFMSLWDLDQCNQYVHLYIQKALDALSFFPKDSPAFLTLENITKNLAHRRK